jgi:hypothetical protein
MSLQDMRSTGRATPTWRPICPWLERTGPACAGLWVKMPQIFPPGMAFGSFPPVACTRSP